jgi:hypothetical protein
MAAPLVFMERVEAPIQYYIVNVRCKDVDKEHKY